MKLDCIRIHKFLSERSEIVFVFVAVEVFPILEREMKCDVMHVKLKWIYGIAATRCCLLWKQIGEAFEIYVDDAIKRFVGSLATTLD